jgi:hypothetical protein
VAGWRCQKTQGDELAANLRRDSAPDFGVWEATEQRKQLSVVTDGYGEHAFFSEPGKQHANGGHVLLDRWRRGLALKCLDVGRDRNGLNVFQVLVTGTLNPSQELLNRPVIGGPCVRVADRDRKKLEELFLG